MCLPGPGKKYVSLTGSYINEGATLDFVLSKPPPATEQWAVWPTKIVCRGEAILKVTITTYEQATFHVPGLQLEPTARRMIQTPASEADSFEVPEDRSEGMVNDCLREDRDTRVDPKEAHLQSVRVDRCAAGLRSSTRT